MLPPGSYIIGAVYRAGAPGVYDPFVSDALTISTTPGVTCGIAREIRNTQMLTCPTDFRLNEHNGFFGPNFRVVPEPSTLALTAIGITLLCGRRRTTNGTGSGGVSR
jgi:hypothetical protein